MCPSISDAMKEAIFAGSTGESWCALVTITHDDLPAPIRITDGPVDDFGDGLWGVTSNGDDFYFIPFELTLPTEDEERLPTVRLSIDNITREILSAIRDTSVTSAPDVVIQTVMASAPDDVQQELGGLKIRNVRANAKTVDLDLSFERLDLEEFPYGTYNEAEFPGLFD
jgi:hypothetical protein